jgi:alcohol dehydrogenase class IV
VPGPGLPLIAVPTTAGTGSEVTRVAVITDSDRDVKMMMLDGHLMARVAISDYKLTISTPPHLTAWVGVDSLTHAIEAYVSKRATVLTDMLALEAARLIGANLRRAVSTPDDESAREAMMLGATLAGAAFSNSSVALVHGMSRPIGAHFHLAHGLSNALLLPAVTRFSVGGAPARYATIAREMGIAGADDTADTACERLVDELDALNADLDIPSLSAAGVEREHFERVVEDMAQAALDSGSPGFNPQPSTKEEIVALYHEAY